MNPLVYVCFGMCFFMLIAFIIAAEITGADDEEE